MADECETDNEEWEDSDEDIRGRHMGQSIRSLRGSSFAQTPTANSWDLLDELDEDASADVDHPAACRCCSLSCLDDDFDETELCGACEPDDAEDDFGTDDTEDIYQTFSTWAHKTSIQIKGQTKEQARTFSINSIAELGKMLKGNSKVPALQPLLLRLT